ncbi:pyruvate kinase [Candidatus Cryosericum hinesii]|nr:pyruvate kinase [Candidatus Cryosericum hinesii]
MPDNMNVKRTKVVATLGPATNSEEMIRALAERGVGIFRINFSHGTEEQRLAVIAAVKKVRGELDLPLAILQDLQGPKIRLGVFSQGPCEIATGGTFCLTTHMVDGNAEQASVECPPLTTEVRPGELIFINDGLIRLKAREIRGETIVTDVLKGGVLSDHKGVNFPQSDLHVPSITEKDKHDLVTGLRAGVDYVALSFVRTPDDVRELRTLMETYGAHVPIIVKVEKWQAVQNIESILAVANGIMVARGDLGVEMPIEEIPIIQKRIIALCNRMGKPVITATQMLNSMVENPSPTRAEVTDVANAIFDGTDAVMLSNETAVGKFPVETVEMMGRIIEATERSKMYWTTVEARDAASASDTSDAIAHAAVRTAQTVGAKLIVCATESGRTAILMSRCRPRTRILALTPSDLVQRRLALYFGIIPMVVQQFESVDDILRTAVAMARMSHLARRGDKIIITAGSHAGVAGSTNLIKVEDLD